MKKKTQNWTIERKLFLEHQFWVKMDDDVLIRCENCTKLFVNRHTLHRHQKTCLVHDGELEQLHCSTENCSYMTNRADNLKRHESKGVHKFPKTQEICQHCQKSVSFWLILIVIFSSRTNHSSIVMKLVVSKNDGRGTDHANFKIKFVVRTCKYFLLKYSDAQMKRARLPFSLVVNSSIITNPSTTPSAAFNIECSTMPRNLKTSRIILPKQIASNGIDPTAVVQILENER